MDGDKDDSQMESANRSQALDKRGPKIFETLSV